MMIYVREKCKKRKGITKKQKEEYDNWLKSINSIPSITGKKVELKTKNNKLNYDLKTPAGRETPNYKSLDTGLVPATKPIQGNVYTGTEMKGIGTLHKSNAVPIFTNEEALDQARMRR